MQMKCTTTVMQLFGFSCISAVVGSCCHRQNYMSEKRICYATMLPSSAHSVVNETHLGTVC